MLHGDVYLVAYLAANVLASAFAIAAIVLSQSWAMALLDPYALLPLAIVLLAVCLCGFGFVFRSPREGSFRLLVFVAMLQAVTLMAMGILVQPTISDLERVDNAPILAAYVHKHAAAYAANVAQSMSDETTLFTAAFINNRTIYRPDTFEGGVVRLATAFEDAYCATAGRAFCDVFPLVQTLSVPRVYLGEVGSTFWNISIHATTTLAAFCTRVQTPSALPTQLRSICRGCAAILHKSAVSQQLANWVHEKCPARHADVIGASCVVDATGDFDLGHTPTIQVPQTTAPAGTTPSQTSTNVISISFLTDHALLASFYRPSMLPCFAFDLIERLRCQVTWLVTPSYVLAIAFSIISQGLFSLEKQRRMRNVLPLPTASR
ncbi:hypothetical protein SDRG_14887 [Saprolegnia diclina VS20]|uniref:Transmembrane protein n=1 Tax=Saprolegnia diclina (strain VS20) TaxID=1156394 RepID=T0Q1K5_SAPDV|nr:hypothetical protein SDRG_14887 [Saprolegnia diclina VS20]EQC27265.1 hypothetical protein SDRG_14887 [Saprolegnia diclina VS20]|eukprot:XP_008619268.1 hypothetical protein SDRG_14887 [Saprolegnia diclina VS20]